MFIESIKNNKLFIMLGYYKIDDLLLAFCVHRKANFTKYFKKKCKNTLVLFEQIIEYTHPLLF